MWHHFHSVLLDESQWHFDRMKPSIVSMDDRFPISRLDLADTLIYKMLQNGRDIMVSVEFAVLR
jgi:uncharacterized membrane protein